MNAADPRPFVITPKLVGAARDAARREGRPLLEVLEDQAGVSAELFARTLAAAFDYPWFDMVRLHAAIPAFERIGFADAAGRGAVAVEDAQLGPTLVFADPFDADLEAWARAKLRCSFALAIAHRLDLDAYLAQQEEKLRAMEAIVPDSGVIAIDSATEELSLVTISGDTSPVVKLVNSTLYDALKMLASDIHLESEADGLAIKYRVDGVLVSMGQVKGLEMAEQVVSRVKVLAELDIAERRIPQDGRFKVLVKGREIDFRVSVMPSIFGEDAVLRLLDRRALTEASQALTLESLGLNAGAMSAIRRLSAKPHGMLLVTGPTGSGKTTTLYAAITEINTGRDKIITIEDPVEYRLPHILQIPVNEQKGLTFARGLRSILRHDPDKIMVGEIRDEETAEIAVQAALTGHLVFTTVHANSVYDVLGRFLHMNVDPYSFSSALNGIVAQRLLRMTCEQCAVPFAPSAEALEESGLDLARTSGWNFRMGKGCGQCRGTGYKGRRAIAEAMILNDELRELIAGKAPLSTLKLAAARAGVVPMREAAFALVKSGETTLDEVNRVTF